MRSILVPDDGKTPLWYTYDTLIQEGIATSVANARIKSTPENFRRQSRKSRASCNQALNFMVRRCAICITFG